MYNSNVVAMIALFMIDVVLTKKSGAYKQKLTSCPDLDATLGHLNFSFTILAPPPKPTTLELPLCFSETPFHVIVYIFDLISAKSSFSLSISVFCWGHPIDIPSS